MLSTSSALYIIVGWTVIVAAPAIVVSIPASGLALMVSGGIAYAVGAIVFLRGRPIRDPTCSASTRSGRLHHRGAVSHFAMVWLVVAWAAHPPPP
jgi:hemolysin III